MYSLPYTPVYSCVYSTMIQAGYLPLHSYTCTHLYSIQYHTILGRRSIYYSIYAYLYTYTHECRHVRYTVRSDSRNVYNDTGIAYGYRIVSCEFTRVWHTSFALCVNTPLKLVTVLLYCSYPRTKQNGRPDDTSTVVRRSQGQTWIVVQWIIRYRQYHGRWQAMQHSNLPVCNNIVPCDFQVAITKTAVSPMEFPR